MFTIKTIVADSIPKKYLSTEFSELRGKRILIIDDNENNSKILSFYFKQWGMSPNCFLSGKLALDCLRNGEKFDLAFVDFHMPEMNGFEVGEKIKEITADNPLKMVLFTSSFSFKDDKQIFSHILSKPLKKETLFNLISSIFMTKLSQIIATPMDNSNISFSPLKILVAEDNQINQKLILKMLEKLGYLADIVSNGLEVISSINRQDYDLIFMDVQMPEMDGIEATSYIVENLVNNKRPKIIAMTANAMDSDREKCLLAGMDDFLSKPVSIKDIQLMIHKWE